MVAGQGQGGRIWGSLLTPSRSSHSSWLGEPHWGHRGSLDGQRLRPALLSWGTGLGGPQDTLSVAEGPDWNREARDSGAGHCVPSSPPLKTGATMTPAWPTCRIPKVGKGIAVAQTMQLALWATVSGPGSLWLHPDVPQLSLPLSNVRPKKGPVTA